jgi:uncharacterized protein with ParB-like and HNH nuclease domain
MDVNANDRTLESILTGGFYRVPGFQRPYSWDPTNIEEFWDDVREASGDYFIGSMVIFVDGGVSGLIDGQQRLTTITMMLAAIRNQLSELDSKVGAAGVQTLIERKDSRGKRRFVLQAESSYPYLQAAIQSAPGDAKVPTADRAEDRSLQKAFAQLTDHIRSIRTAAEENEALSKPEQRREAIRGLERLRDKIYGLTVVLIEVGDEDDATTIFQTLNSRGKDLETADLVKAHLLQMLKAPNADLSQARDQWDSIRQSFDESAALINVNRFLLHASLSREDYVAEKELFAKIKKKVRSNNAQDYLDELQADAERYRTIHEASFRTWKKPQLPVMRSLEAMSLFRLQQPLPFVLAVLREYDSKHIKLALLLRALRGVEYYHFLATAVTSQPSSGGVSRMYAAAARAVLKGSSSSKKAKAIDELLDKLRERKPTYPEFEAAFIELRSSRQFKQQTPVVRYALDKLHVTLKDISTPPVDMSQLTVEHLVPQGAKGASSLTAADVARIGNLILVSEDLNQRLDDKSFAEKKKLLKKVPEVEAEILKAASWQAPEILARSKHLATRAYGDVWKF